MKNILGGLTCVASLILTPVDAIARYSPVPGEPGYDPNIPTWMAPRTIYLRHPYGHEVRIDLTEAYESHHYDYLVVYGPEGEEHIQTKCIDGSWVRRGVYTHTTSYLDKLVSTLCGKQVRT